MPVYEYKCLECGKISELFIRNINEKENFTCHSCGSGALKRFFSGSVSLNLNHAGSKQSSCCGNSTPCDHPKKCCESK
jgi:putative FmdB family regulatory protein